ncbi:hypothetical protein Flavo103_14350 [Flavobacterium collinsii]|nr:hypothetical protein Flavo103_14350 [Flavobacterium collinsii]
MFILIYKSNIYNYPQVYFLLLYIRVCLLILEIGLGEGICWFLLSLICKVRFRIGNPTVCIYNGNYVCLSKVKVFKFLNLVLGFRSYSCYSFQSFVPNTGTKGFSLLSGLGERLLKEVCCNKREIKRFKSKTYGLSVFVRLVKTR